MQITFFQYPGSGIVHYPDCRYKILSFPAGCTYLYIKIKNS